MNHRQLVFKIHRIQAASEALAEQTRHCFDFVSKFSVGCDLCLGCQTKENSQAEGEVEVQDLLASGRVGQAEPREESKAIVEENEWGDFPEVDFTISLITGEKLL